MTEPLTQLKQRLAEIYDLQRAFGVLSWDRQTMMPPQGGPGRAEAAATLRGIAHERFVADETGQLLEQVTPLEDSLDYDSDDASLIRVTRREWEKARRVPPEIPAAWAREAGKAHAAWLEARSENDFAVFLPAFRRVHDVALRWAEHMEPGDSPYDAFLDEYEPGMKTAEVKAVFDVLRPELAALVRDAGEPADDSFLEGDFPVEKQQEVSAAILRDFGFEEGTYRLDPTVHPFATYFSVHGHPDDDALPAGQPALALAVDARGRARAHLPRRRSGAAPLPARRERVDGARRVAEPHAGRTWSGGRSRSGAAASRRSSRRSRSSRGSTSTPGTAASTASRRA